MASGTVNDRGRLGSVTAGMITVSPNVLSVGMSSSGTNAAARGRTARRGHTYHFAASAYVTMVAAVCSPKIVKASMSPPARDGCLAEMLGGFLEAGPARAECPDRDPTHRKP